MLSVMIRIETLWDILPCIEYTLYSIATVVSTQLAVHTFIVYRIQYTHYAIPIQCTIQYTLYIIQYIQKTHGYYYMGMLTYTLSMGRPQSQSGCKKVEKNSGYF